MRQDVTRSTQAVVLQLTSATEGTQPAAVWEGSRQAHRHTTLVAALAGCGFIFASIQALTPGQKHVGGVVADCNPA